MELIASVIRAAVLMAVLWLIAAGGARLVERGLNAWDGHEQPVYLAW